MIITKTTQMALKALVYITLREDGAWMSPRSMAEHLDVSASYLSKIVSDLVKADILLAQRGAHGGVQLSRPADQITLLEVVESCQGKILGDYCREANNIDLVCTYHRVMKELHEANVDILQRWTLQDLTACPERDTPGVVPCIMAGTGLNGP